jgi:hypothetical protein
MIPVAAVSSSSLPLSTAPTASAHSRHTSWVHLAPCLTQALAAPGSALPLPDAPHIARYACFINKPEQLTCCCACCISPLFVTLKMPAKSGGSLVQRGCIGNLSPLGIQQGLWDYARSRCAAPVRYQTQYSSLSVRTAAPSRTSAIRSLSPRSWSSCPSRSPSSRATRSARAGTSGKWASTGSPLRSSSKPSSTGAHTCPKLRGRRVRQQSLRPSTRPPDFSVWRRLTHVTTPSCGLIVANGIANTARNYVPAGLWLDRWLCSATRLPVGLQGGAFGKPSTL